MVLNLSISQSLPFYLHPHPHISLHTHTLSLSLSLSLSFFSMALQSVSPIPHLLHTSSSSSPKPSILASSNNGRYFIDFVGLHCKSKRTRRKFTATSRTFSHFVSSSKVKAVLDLARNNSASEESDSRTDLRPKVRFSFLLGLLFFRVIFHESD